MSDSDVDMLSVCGDGSGSEEGEIGDTDTECEPEQTITRTRTTKSNSIAKESLGDSVELSGHLSTTTQSTLPELYESLGVEEGSEARRHTRLDTIHMYGTRNMDTNDVFQYFDPRKPLFLEWVNESCCNVVWSDDLSAVQALLVLSKEDDGTSGPPPGKWRLGVAHPKAENVFLRFATKSDKKVTGKDKLKVHSKKYKDDHNIHATLISKSMKSQIQTIEIDPYSERSKNPWGELCQTWGINDSQEVFGVSDYKRPPPLYHSEPPHRTSSARNRISSSVKDRIGRTARKIPIGPRPNISQRLSLPSRRQEKLLSLKMRLGKRAITPEPVGSGSEDSCEQAESSDSDEEWTKKSKAPRMRMHADDVEEKMNRNRPRAREDSSTITVEIENDIVVQGHSGKRMDLRRRLTHKQGALTQGYSSASDEGDTEPSTTIWARLDLPKSKMKLENESDDVDHVRYAVSKTCPNVPSSRPGFEKTDLRSRLRKNKVPGSPLRIEVDNEHYVNSD